MGRVAIVVAAAAVAAGVLGGCGHGSGTAPDANTAGAAGKPPAASTVRTINIKVHGGKASGDTGRITVPVGSPVVLSVSSDVADEIHVHGYDRKANVPAGATASVVFSANNPGVFEVELENSKLQLVQLQVG
ncbi:MAG TPA: hypothetical protein VJS67_07090 [Pseudonocardiaceae bacterium]|jgi:heme/copper-type cytochrome/quinol oxidase subunit 2|nr:hypothetical protein [Pseudonocardiaceae bacterium]